MRIPPSAHQATAILPKRRDMRLKTVTSSLFALALLAVLPLPAAANHHGLHILSVQADTERGLLLIRGENLGNSTPQVLLGEITLEVWRATAQEIEAMLPAGIEPGSYPLTIAP